MASSDEAARLRALDAERAEVIAAARKLRASMRASSKAAERHWVLTGSVRNAVLIMFDLAQGDTEPALVYLDGIRRQYGWPEQPSDDVVRLVEDTYLEATSTDNALAEYAALVNATNPTDAAAMRLAVRRVEEWRVVVWSRRQNVEKGLAPCGDLLLQRAEDSRALLPEAVRPPQRGTSMEGRNRKWVTRVCMRYGGRRGKIRPRDVLTQVEMRDKAMSFRHGGLRSVPLRHIQTQGGSPSSRIVTDRVHNVWAYVPCGVPLHLCASCCLTDHIFNRIFIFSLLKVSKRSAE